MTTVFASLGCLVAALAALLPLRRAVFVLSVVLGALMWFGAAWQGGIDAARPLASACVFLVVLLLRRIRQDHRQAVALLHAERSAHKAQLEIAAGKERERIARDLHDSLTHLLTSQLLVLQTARAALADGDATTTDARLSHAIRLSRRTLVEARDVVDVLRGLTPNLDLVRTTVGDWSAATGHQVELVLPELTPDLSGAAWGVILATVREALTNVARHRSGEQVGVWLTHEQNELDLTIDNWRLADLSTEPNPRPLAVNAALPVGGGMGLQGLRERAALAGGALSAGPTGDRWSVHLTLPIEPPR